MTQPRVGPDMQRSVRRMPVKLYGRIKGGQKVYDDPGAAELARLSLEGQYFEETLSVRGNHPTPGQYRAWWGHYIPAAQRALKKKTGRYYSPGAASEAMAEAFTRQPRTSILSPSSMGWLMDQVELWLLDWDEPLPPKPERLNVEDDGEAVPADVGQELERLTPRK